MDTLSVVRTSRDTCSVACPACKRRNNLRMESLRNCYTLNISCSCGRDLQLVTERRGFERKSVELPGKLFDVMTLDLLTDITVIDLALGGLSFIAHDHVVEKDEPFTVSFGLDDEVGSVIREEITVKSLKAGNRVGAEFIYKDAYNFDLDFYLTPWSLQP